MKSLKSILLGLTVVLLWLGCSKDETIPAPDPTSTIVGTWSGKYGLQFDEPNLLLTFIIKDDKTVQFSDNQNDQSVTTGSGTWVLSADKKFEATVHFNGQQTDFVYTAEYDDTNGKLINGTFGLSPSKSGVGTWYLNKK